MKKITLMAFGLFLLQTGKAQHFTKGYESIPVQQTEKRVAGSTQNVKSTKDVTFAGDVIIESTPTISQGKVKLSVAFNGWLYSAFSTFNSSTNSRGITIRKSTNNGASWTTIDSYTFTSTTYPSYDIVVAGTDTNNLTLYLAGINANTSTGVNILFVDRYNATTNTYIDSNYNTSSLDQIYDVAIASDYRNPSITSAPYSVALVYSKYGTYDSVNYVASIDGGTTFNQFQNIMATGYYARNVSISYGKSLSASNGRYFAAWEVLESSTARNGHIYTSRNASEPTSNFITPVNLDSLSSAMINVCRHPSIATQFNNIDNDSAACSAVVMVERDYVGDGSDYDLLGFYNMRSHFTNYWYRLDVVNSGENDLHPSASYDPAFNNFLLTYYDSTNSKLPYVVHGFNIGTTPDTWTTINPQYNDVTTNLLAAWPTVEINPISNKAAFAWTRDGVGHNGVAMFDAEYNSVGIFEKETLVDLSMYPNPSTGTFTLASSENIANVKAFNIVGKEVALTKLYGKTYTFPEVANGVYFIKVTTDKGIEKTEKLIIK
jgi:Secretion system C-terminal sorting domain